MVMVGNLKDKLWVLSLVVAAFLLVALMVSGCGYKEYAAAQQAVYEKQAESKKAEAEALAAALASDEPEIQRMALMVMLARAFTHKPLRIEQRRETIFERQLGSGLGMALGGLPWFLALDRATAHMSGHGGNTNISADRGSGVTVRGGTTAGGFDWQQSQDTTDSYKDQSDRSVTESPAPSP